MVNQDGQLSFLSPEFQANQDRVQILELIDAAPRNLESALYEPVATFLNSCWAPRENLREWIVEITANQGRRQTGGLWTRPDLVVLGMWAYPFVPGKNLDISTFEIKKTIEEAIEGVYEAAAHSAVAHRSFLLAKVSPADYQTDELYCRIVSECQRFGLGFITVEGPERFESYCTVVEPACRYPNTALMNKFIATQLSEQTKQSLLAMLR